MVYKTIVVIVTICCCLVGLSKEQGGPVNCSPSTCNRLCTEPDGVCQSDGKCLCAYGNTGPNATSSGVNVYLDQNKNEVESTDFYIYQIELVSADHCLWNCNPHAYLNKDCLSTCNKRCAFPFGVCQNDGWCECHWGWTGPNAFFLSNNRILADYCIKACHYTHDATNAWCGRL